VLTLLPGAVVALGASPRLRVAIAGFAGARRGPGVLAGLDLVVLGYRLQLDFALPGVAWSNAYFVYANWHLLGTPQSRSRCRMRELLTRELAPLTLVIAAACCFSSSASLSPTRDCGRGPVDGHRATLHLAPLLVVWMLLVSRAWMARLQPDVPVPVARSRKHPPRACRIALSRPCSTSQHLPGEQPAGAAWRRRSPPCFAPDRAPSHAVTKLSYQPRLDHLRCLAALIVCLFHIYHYYYCTGSR